MKKFIQKIAALIAFCLLSAFYSPAQTLTPKATPACGGYFSAGGKSLSWTMGETFNTTLVSGTKMLTQGEQQPYFLKLIHLKEFIEGYYIGSGQMQPLLYTANLSLDPTACDSITVELHDAAAPYATYVSTKVLIHTDGSADVHFPGVIANNSYYIAVFHRNAVETWSKVPVKFNDAIVSFDLTSP
jgi:hypothetical protein